MTTYHLEPLIQGAIDQITEDIHRLNTGEHARYRADKAEAIARFARALENLALHQYNLDLDPALAEDEDYIRMALNGYNADIADWADPFRVETPIWVDTKKTRKELTTKFEHQVKHMQVTGYDLDTHVHELTFTLNDGTTRTANTRCHNNGGAAVLEHLRLTKTTLRPYFNFTTRKRKLFDTELTLELHTILN